MRADQGSASAVQDRSSASPTSPSACPTAGREVLNSVFLYHCVQGRTGPRDRQLREARALRRRSPKRSAGWPRTSSGGAATIRWRPSPRYFRERKAEPQRRAATLAAAGRAAGPLHRGGLQGRARSTTSTQALGRAIAARHHQRAAHERDGRGRPAVQRQPADRGRGAADRRGDEGRGRLSRAAHGEGRERQRAARSLLATVKGDVHDIGKNLVDIILSNNGYRGREPRHQGAARGADRGRTASTSPTPSASPACW